MTRPVIDDAMVERAWKAVQGMYPDKRSIRDALEAALDRRTGEADRRKVRDYDAEIRRCNSCGTRNEISGRRSTDMNGYWNLPLAKPPIHVSEGMRKAGNAAFENWWHDPSGNNSLSCSVAVYTAMEAKRREEAGE